MHPEVPEAGLAAVCRPARCCPSRELPHPRAGASEVRLESSATQPRCFRNRSSGVPRRRSGAPHSNAREVLPETRKCRGPSLE
eukprot:10602837-Alexandrium_andersonii.AAC.1